MAAKTSPLPPFPPSMFGKDHNARKPFGSKPTRARKLGIGRLGSKRFWMGDYGQAALLEHAAIGSGPRKGLTPVPSKIKLHTHITTRT